MKEFVSKSSVIEGVDSILKSFQKDDTSVYQVYDLIRSSYFVEIELFSCSTIFMCALEKKFNTVVTVLPSDLPSRVLLHFSVSKS